MKKLFLSIAALVVCCLVQADITSISQLRLTSSTNNYCEVFLAVDNAGSATITGSSINMSGKSIAIYAIGDENLATASATSLDEIHLGILTDAGTEFTIEAILVQGEPLKLFDALHPDAEVVLTAGASYVFSDINASAIVNDRFIINHTAAPADILELNGTLGTIVSDREIASVPDGVVLYEILETDYANHITFQEVALPLAAGTPVLFQRTGDAAYVTLGTDYTTGEYVYANGFVGLLPGKDSRTVNVNSHVLVLVTADCKLKFATTSLTLTAGHAYIDMNAIIPANPAPGRRRLMIGRNGIVTDVENVAAEVKGARKSIENGKIVILKNGIKYNVAGQMMK